MQLIAPGFGGINLEDIAAPRCFAIERKLQKLGIPVFHDDQHGTAIACLAALLNACRWKGRALSTLRVVISGAGAAGTAIARLLMGVDYSECSGCPRVADVILCDSKGAICSKREDLSLEKRELLHFANLEDRSGCLEEVLKGTDVFIGVSTAHLLKKEQIATMAPEPFVFAMANPIPEISPSEAYAGGASVVATGRSDFPNQVNNALVFPGLFRGALDAASPTISARMKLAAVFALANCVQEPSRDHLLPSLLDPQVAPAVAQAVYNAVI